MSSNHPNYIPKQYFDPRQGQFYYNQRPESEADTDDEFSDIEEEKENIPKYGSVRNYYVRRLLEEPIIEGNIRSK